MTGTAIAEQPDGMDDLLRRLRKVYGKDAVDFDADGRPRLTVDGQVYVLVPDEAYQALLQHPAPAPAPAPETIPLVWVEDKANALAAHPGLARLVEILKRGRRP